MDSCFCLHRETGSMRPCMGMLDLTGVPTCHVAVDLCGLQGATPIRIDGEIAGGAAGLPVCLT